MKDLLTILEGDAVERLRTLETGSVQCCVTSPPYYGLRDYGFCSCRKHRIQHESSTLAGTQAGTPNHVGPPNPRCELCGGTGRVKGTERQLGLESAPAAYVARLVDVFREVRRVLRQDGTLWLNLGDSYAGSGKGSGGTYELSKKQNSNRGSNFRAGSGRADGIVDERGQRNRNGVGPVDGIKPKDLIGIPWMTAFALRADGWWLRSRIDWIKKSCMPESVTDRPTNAVEDIFLLSKSQRYFYDSEAVKESKAEATINDDRENENGERRDRLFPGSASNGGTNLGGSNGKRNMRNYWILGPEPFADAHFATFPTEIPRRAILAGSKPGDLILDPFAGSGTTGMVALELGRKALLIELNPEYCKLIKQRCNVTPGLALA